MRLLPAGQTAPSAWALGVLRPGRLRWFRLVGWFVVLVLLVGGATSMLGWAFHTFAPARGPGAAMLLHFAIACAVGLGVYAALVRWGERRDVTELSLKRALPELGLGLVGGATMFGSVMLVLVGLGGYTLTGPTQAAPWPALSLSLSSGIMEELLFRGILFRLLWGALGLGWALTLSSIVFGLLHLLNPAHDVMGALSLIVEAGLLLAALYAVTGRLYASMGAHFAWNFSQGYLFGAEVSGTDFGAALFTAHPVPGASALLTGGGFGPEASLPAVVAGLLAAIGLLSWNRRTP